MVIVKGVAKSNVISCKNRLQVIVSTARQKQQFNHLITFPVVFDDLKKNLLEFKEKVLANCSSDRGVDSSIFLKSSRIHLTLGTLVLMDKREKDDAINLLSECKRTFIKELLNDKPLQIHLKGLEYMNDDPSSVDVLYIKVKSVVSVDGADDLIQVISEKVVEKFLNAGLMKKQFDRVKLHASVMNTLLRREENPSEENELNSKAKQTDSKDRESFDARNILKLYGDYDFGKYNLSELHVSIRYTVAVNGYYEPLGMIKF